MNEGDQARECAVYKSVKKNETYLYIKEKENFDDVPDSLIKLLGTLEWVMDVDLAARDKLARADIEQVRLDLKQKGFFLQMPPTDPVLKTTKTH